MRFLLPLLLAWSLHAEVWSIAHYSDCHAGLNTQGTFATNGEALIEFVLANTNDGSFNFRGLISTGDIYEQDTNYLSGGANHSAAKWQFDEITNAFNRVRTNGLFVWTTTGNHDCDNIGLRYWTPDPGGYGTGLFEADEALLWSNAFPLTFYSGQTGFVTNYHGGDDSRSCAMTYTNGTIKLLWIPFCSGITSLVSAVPQDFTVEVTNQVAWASNLVASFPDHQVILGAHFLLSFSYDITRPHFRDDYGEGTALYPYLPHGKSLFQAGALGLNPFLALSGHTRGLWSGHVVLRTPQGGQCDVQCFNMQRFNDAGVGADNGRYLRVLTFDERCKRVNARVYDIVASTELTEPWYRTNGATGQVVRYPIRWSSPLSGRAVRILR